MRHIYIYIIPAQVQLSKVLQKSFFVDDKKLPNLRLPIQHIHLLDHIHPYILSSMNEMSIVRS